MITGQYHPGEIVWFRGSEAGFEPGKNLPQEGDPASNANAMFGREAPEDPIEHFSYWNYSTASFGDFDGDGDFDLVVGGGDSLRISENVGTATEPDFARRKPILDIHGKPLTTKKPLAGTDAKSGPNSTWKTSPYVVDWDGDGVLDILATDDYRSQECMAVAFFRGVKTDEGHRFEPGIDLLETKNGLKALPGSCQRICVGDWNQDGTDDLIIGASVATVNNGEFSDELSWEWENVTEVQSAGKDPGRYPPREKPTLESMKEMFGDRMSDEKLEEMLERNVEYWEETIGKLYKENKGHWLTMRHQGRVYVMLGRPAEEKAVAGIGSEKWNEGLDAYNSNEPMEVLPPIRFAAEPVVANSGSQSARITINLELADGWYIYAATDRNREQEMAVLKVECDLPQGAQTAGNPLFPLHHAVGAYDVIDEPKSSVEQKITLDRELKPGEYDVICSVTFQTCNKDGCLPEQTINVKTKLVVESN